jgi:enoyl-CoA hydratase
MSDSYKMEEWENGVLLFTITREHKRNAINYEVMDGLVEAIHRSKGPNIKALVVTGEGEKAFCSGGDLSVFHELKTEEQAYQMLSRMGDILYQLAMLPKPTVALMNGTAVGGGCEIAAACDFRIARKGVKAGFVQGNLAITTGWGGGTVLLERLSISNAMKMLYEAKRYSLGELVELGFVQYIYEGDSKNGLSSTIGSILNLEGGVLQAYKEVLIRKWKDSNLKERIEKEIRQCAMLWESEAHHKQVDRFIDNKN